MDPGSEMEVVTADTVRDDIGMNLNSGGDNSEASCISTSSLSKLLCSIYVMRMDTISL